MIRKISKKNDYRDIIRSCPSGVIDDIKSIFYFISGHPETEIEANFENVGKFLEVILPTSKLAELGNGVLMRRAVYSTTDSEFPDGEYNLEFVEDMNVWLGDEEVDPPFDPGYLVESDMKTINSDSIVGSGNINLVTPSELSQVVSALSSRIDNNSSSIQSWVSNNYVDNSMFTSTLSSYATQSWVHSQGYLTSHQDLSSYATMNWVESQSYLTSSSLFSYATMNWVSGKISDVVRFNTSSLPSFISEYSYQIAGTISSYIIIESVPTYIGTSDVGLAFTRTGHIAYVGSNFYRGTLVGNGEMQFYVSSVLMDYATMDWVSTALSGYATQSWVESQGYLTSHQDLSSYATMSWVSSQSYLTSASITGYATESWVQSQGYLTSETIPSDIATQSWVQSQGYLTSHQDLSSYATQSWVSDQGYLTSTSLIVYATQSWVESQGYLTSHQDLSSYATQSWVSDQGYLTSTSLTGYATQSWVQSQGYLTSHQDLSSYATMSWVSDQGYLTSTNLSGYATQTWVQNNYGTRSWTSNNFVAKSSIWTGTMDQWILLSPSDQASYIIALIIE